MKKLNVRLRLAEGMDPWYSDVPMDSPEAAIQAMRGLLGEMDREYFCVVNLNAKNCPLNYNVISIGKVNMAPVRLADVFKSSLLSNAKRALLFHNHPSGDPAPSDDDYAVTEKLMEAGEILGIRVLDHVIVGGGRYFSFRETGLLEGWKQSFRKKWKDSGGREKTVSAGRKSLRSRRSAMNRITLYGRLTRKPETLSGSNGKPVCRFSISVRRKYRREGEEYRYDFFDCIAFGKLGELIGSRFGHKDYILISGPVQDNNYERDGQMV